MNMTIVHSAPRILKPISAQLIWEMGSGSDEIFLTFDDGPHPEITPWVIKELAKFNAKATFFLVGENVVKYPEIVDLIIDNGHHIGNHTFNHVKGWSTSAFKYYRNTLKCEGHFKTPLFRPPYGRITRAQHKRLSKKYKIIMWSVLSGDYNRHMSTSNIVDGVLKNTVPGSIIVFHDSEKSELNLKSSLPIILEQLSKKGLVLASIPYDVENSSVVRGEGNV